MIASLDRFLCVATVRIITAKLFLGGFGCYNHFIICCDFVPTIDPGSGHNYISVEVQ
jgi:hypothetical protein